MGETVLRLIMATSSTLSHCRTQTTVTFWPLLRNRAKETWDLTMGYNPSMKLVSALPAAQRASLEHVYHHGGAHRQR
jgi:hypothetical protein